MSPQITFLKELITIAQAGDEKAIAMVRDICGDAARQAPLSALIEMAQCLLRLGIEATKIEAGRN